MDIWIAVNSSNAEKTAEVLREFEMPVSEVVKKLFLEKDKIIRMGFPPVRIEVITGVSGVNFQECYANRIRDRIDAIPINLISLEGLKINKKASGRHKDLEDLEHLP